MSSQDRQWNGKTGGGSFGQKFLFWALSKVKVSAIYPILYLVIPFYMLFGRKGYKAIMAYFRNHHGMNWLQAFKATFNNHIIFGKVVLDKFAVLAGNTNQFTITVDNMNIFTDVTNQPEGFVVASAHIGNFELAGRCLTQDKKAMYGLVFGGETKQMQEHRDKNETSNLKPIPVASDMSHLFAMKDALETGGIISVPCERLFGSQKSYTCSLLGKDAKFPIGIFRIASQLNVPVLGIFIMKEKGLTYHGYVRKFKTLENETSSVKQAENYGKQYVAFLEEMLLKYPEQWFNYYDFWNELN